jgi:type IV pilus assembly protein PilN
MLDFNFASKPFEDIRRYFILIIFLIAVLVIFTGFNIYTFINYRKNASEMLPETKFLEEKKSKLELNIKQNKAELDKSDFLALKKEAGELNKLIEQRTFSWTKLLNNLEKTIPPELQVISIKPKTDENDIRITISVKAVDYNGILKFIKNMESSKYFSDVYPVFEDTQSKGSAREIIADFVFKYDQNKEGQIGKNK